MFCALIFLGLSFAPPIGSHPSLWERYEASIDESAGTFRCFDGSRTIPLSQINDNYGDCDDLSDEPGTGLNHSAMFYCHNNDGTPQEIPYWSVGDGVCDCDDGSDEAFNPHVTCENLCLRRVTKKERLVAELKALCKARYKSIEQYRKEGEQVIAKLEQRLVGMKNTINLLERKKQRIQENPVLDVPLPKRDRPKDEWVKKLYSVWNFTFRAPRARINGPQTMKILKIAAVEKEIAKANEKMKRITDRSGWQFGLDKAYAVLLAKEFALGDFKLVYLREVTRRGENIGIFREMNLNAGVTHVYRGDNKTFECEMMCGPSNQLVDVEEVGVNEWHGLFASPIFCSEEQARKLDGMSYEEVVRMASLFKNVKDGERLRLIEEL